jgi:hypothetical protein
MTKPAYQTYLPALLGLTAPLALGGCLLGAAVEVVGETVEAGVEITGAAAGAVVDVVTPGGKDDDVKDKSIPKSKSK